MARATAGHRFWRWVLVAFGLYLGTMFFVGLNYALRSCAGSFSRLHCGFDNALVWSDNSFFGFAVLIYLVILFGLWIRK